MEGRLSINKIGQPGRPKQDYISIRIEDKLSSIEFVSVKVDLRTFTEALFGLGHIPIEFELRGIERIGKKLETKTVQVSIPTAPNEIGLTDKDIDIAVAYYETDGWMGCREDCKNHHNYVRRSLPIPAPTAVTYQIYKVSYHRYV